jgi:hypothetical protein
MGHLSDEKRRAHKVLSISTLGLNEMAGRQLERRRTFLTALNLLIR